MDFYFERCTILKTTDVYYTSGTHTPKLGNYTTDTTVISTPKSREQDRILELNRQLRDINNY